MEKTDKEENIMMIKVVERKRLRKGHIKNTE